MNHVLCDGGLCNRLNALIFALVLRRKYGHAWQIAWPLNNWCGAAFESLFASQLGHDRQSIDDFKRNQAAHLLLMHENQMGFDPGRLVLTGSLDSCADYQALLDHASGDGQSVVYFNSLIPRCADAAEVRNAVLELEVEPSILHRAQQFCLAHRIDATVVGLHIRKTDFGDRVDDEALYAEAAASSRRFFVCSDSAQVSARFAQLPNCVVFGKSAYPAKLQSQGAWLQATTDTAGRSFPFNIERSGESVVDALVDLLILSRTEIRPTSTSTFLAMANLFKASGFFTSGDMPPPGDAAPTAVQPPAGASARDLPKKGTAMNAPLEAKKFDLSQVDENEHLIPRPYGTLQSLNLDHLYRYAFAKGFCYNADVLDAAMGCGYSSLLLNCKSYTGVDIDPNMVAFANEVYMPMTRGGRYLQGSVLELPVPDHSIDTYISFETIEHIQPSEVAQYFAEVKRVLRPGGRFICSTPIYRGDKFGLLTRYHPYEFRYQQFEATLVGQGFQLLDTLYQWPPHFTLEHVSPSFAQTQQAAPFLTVCVCQLPG